MSAHAQHGVYYAALDCHVDNPYWGRWKQSFEVTGIATYDYSLDAVAAAFRQVGFIVAAQKFMPT